LFKSRATIQESLEPEQLQVIQKYGLTMLNTNMLAMSFAQHGLDLMRCVLLDN